MRNFAAGRPIAPRSNWILLLLIVGLATAAAFAPLSSSTKSISDVLLRRVSQARVGDGRFFRAYGSPPDNGRLREALLDAEVFLVSAPESSQNLRLRALLDASSGRLREAAQSLQGLSNTEPDNAEILNDLGVVYLALGEENATNYFKAAELFERSASAAPGAPAPRFNAALAFRKGELHDLADHQWWEFRRLQSPKIWNPEPPSNASPTISSLMDRLHERLAAADRTGAQELLNRYPPQFRKASMERALNPTEDESFSNEMAFVLNHFAEAGTDQTPRAILDPLLTPERDRVLHSRRLVQKGVDAYFKGKLIESLQLYDRAAVAMGADPPLFDKLWIQLKRADTLVRSTGPPGGPQNLAKARRLTDEVVTESRARRLEWLVGQALVSQNAASASTQDYDQTLPILQEAVDKLSIVGTPEDLARPLFYLATVYSIAGDSERSLDTAYQALRMTEPDQKTRLAQLYWLSGVQLSRMGYTRYAKSLEQQAVSNAYGSENPTLVASIVPVLAFHHAREGDYDAALKYLQEAEKLRGQIRSEGEGELSSLNLNLLCGLVMTKKGDLEKAEQCLKDNLSILNRQLRIAPEYFADTLLQLAGISAAKGQIHTTRQTLRRALDVVEEHDAYLATSALRMPFESHRRDVYDRAIDFEYDQGAKDAAWSHVQRYRSKLFLEFLRQTNSAIRGILDKTIDRSQVQRLIPEDVQVLEYVMLKDRLLIWLVSRDKFYSVAVPVARSEIEAKVSAFLTQINKRADIRLQSSELYKLLIAPIESQLDPKRTLAIVPDLALHRLNFPALYAPASGKFLLQQFTLLESPNLTTLLSGRNGRPARSKVVAFGARQDNVGATGELRALNQIYGDVKIFNGPDALKPSLLSSMTQASTLHYAGHSQDAADPLRSSILLDGDREGLNSVTAAEISRQRMPSNSVVVLASCDSSVGNSRDGIGMRGLTSAFLISGAGSVVGSLWLVESDSTSQLVLRFHRDFAAGTPVAHALRDAQLASIAAGAHPYYWSGFVVTGNTSALN